METAQLQHAIRLTGFKVLKFQMDATDWQAALLETNTEIEFHYSLAFSVHDNHSFCVIFALAILEQPGQNLLPGPARINVTAEAWFRSKKAIDMEFKSSSIARQNAPAIAFPYLRSFVSTVTINAGAPQIILPTYNFSRQV
jgi:preprotein translocase subunit SecB